METKNAESKCKHSSEIEPREESKSFKFSLLAVSTKGLVSTNSGVEEKSCLRKCSSVIKYNRKQKDTQKATNPGNKSEPNQMDVKAPSKQFARTDQSTCVQTEQKDQEGCLAPSSIKSHGFEASITQDRAFDIQEKVLPEKTQQGMQVREKVTAERLKREAAQDEQSPPKDGKKTSSRERAQKEFHDALKARMGELRQENTLLSQELRRHSTMCMQLIQDNTLLMDELKKMCKPCVVEFLEAKNPDKDP